MYAWATYVYMSYDKKNIETLFTEIKRAVIAQSI
jgi:hypothetical protein